MITILSSTNVFCCSYFSLRYVDFSIADIISHKCNIQEHMKCNILYLSRLESEILERLEIKDLKSYVLKGFYFSTLLIRHQLYDNQLFFSLWFMHESFFPRYKALWENSFISNIKKMSSNKAFKKRLDCLYRQRL